MNNDEKIIEDAQELYNKGRWQEAIEMLNKLKSHNEEEVAEANRIKGWSYYYLAIKGDKSLKSENLEKAEEYFKLSSIGAKEDKTKISVLNGLPLALWILGKKSEAWEINDKAINIFPETPSIWNTRGIICRWAKNFNEAVEVGQRVFETAVKVKDFRTAGHGKQNKADALVQLGKTEKAKKEYQDAIQLYKDHQQISGQSAEFHLESVRKKLSSL